MAQTAPARNPSPRPPERRFIRPGPSARTQSYTRRGLPRQKPHRENGGRPAAAGRRTPMSMIARLFAEKPCVFSIECFPPKQTTRFAAMQQTLRSMKQLSPDFISVTYGAGGSAGGVSSVQVAEFLQNELGILPLAHTLCMGSDRQKMTAQLEDLRKAGVRNVLALRGERTPLRPESPDFQHASDMMDFTRQTAPDMEFSGACYPEGHPEAGTLTVD